MQRPGFLAAALITFLALATAVVLYGRIIRAREARLPAVPRATRAKPPPGDQSVVSLEGESQVVKRDEDGDILWKASFGADLSYDKASGRVHGRQVECELIVGPDRTLRVRAGGLETTGTGGVLTFTGGVEAGVSKADTSFRAQQASWDTQTRTLRGAGDVMITRGSFVARGRELSVDTAAQQAEVSGGASLTYTGKKGATGHARARKG
jgi:ethanolamine utilization microcompartment shell protein EutS